MMNLKMYNRNEAAEAFDRFVSGEDFVSKLTPEYIEIRNDIINRFSNEGPKYEVDLNFAIELYNYFNSQSWFNETVAANVGFWRYLACAVIPDLIKIRHGLVKSYFYEKGLRIYPNTLWWYIHLCYQGTIESTKKVLKNLNTDYIVQIAERPGKDGTYEEVMRGIVKGLSIAQRKNKLKRNQLKDLARKVLCQNTAMISNYNLLFENKVDQYIKILFKKVKCEI